MDYVLLHKLSLLWVELRLLPVGFAHLLSYYWYFSAPIFCWELSKQLIANLWSLIAYIVNLSALIPFKNKNSFSTNLFVPLQLQTGPPLDEMSIASILRDLLHAIEYLHNEGKIHRDIKGHLLYTLWIVNFSITIENGYWDSVRIKKQESNRSV